MVECVSMSGGFGLYQRDVSFGIIFRDRLYFKTDELTRKEYLKMGMSPFQSNERQTLKSYYEVSVEIVEDADRLADWAREAVPCQGAKRAKRRGGGARRGKKR